MISEKEAKAIILQLIDAGYCGALVDCQDGGEHVDIVFSRIRGKKDQVMQLPEAEALIDTAIIRAFKALTGHDIQEDPVEFIYSKRLARKKQQSANRESEKSANP